MKKLSLLIFCSLLSFTTNLPAKAQELTNMVNSNGETVDQQLVYRVAFGSAQDIKILLSQGANANAKNSVGRPVLMVAALRDHQDAPKIVQQLVEAGAQTNFIENNGDNVFMAAMKYGLPATVEYLMSLKPDLTSTDANGMTLEQLAVERGDQQILAIFKKIHLQEAQAKAAAEAEYRKKTSSTNLKKLLRTYSMQHCFKEYMNFYAKYDADETFDIEKYDANTEVLLHQINASENDLKKYFKLNSKSLNSIELMSRQAIVNELGNMSSTAYRKRAGVGTDADVQKRCGKIANDISLRVSVR